MKFKRCCIINGSKLAVFITLLVIIISGSAASQTLPIYPGAVPNSKTGHQLISQKNNPDIIYTVLKPELEVFLPKKEKATGAAVIICPGGSYKVLVYQAEGVKTAKTFAENGIAAFVLKYRLPDDSTMVDKTIGPLQDAQQAMKFVRENARQWQ